MTRLPGFAYRGDDPDGYLGAAEVAGCSRTTPRSRRRRC